MNQEANLVGQRMSNSDYLLFIDRARKYFYTNYKIPTCQNVTDLVYYPGARENALPSDFIGIIEPERPQDLWSPDFTHETQRALVHWPYGNLTSIKWQRETPFLMMNASEGSKLQLSNCDSLTSGGTWAVSGDGSSLAVDNSIYTEGLGSLRFTITPSGGTTTLTCTSLSRVDLTDIMNNGKLFLDLDCPSTNTVALTSVTLKVGTSSTAYYSMSTTTRFRGDSILTGWGQLAFDPQTKSTTGSPDVTDIEYVQIIISTGLTGVSGTYRVDNLFGSEGQYYQLPYYSKYNVKDVSGNYKERVTATDDTVLCPSDFDELFIYKTLEMVAALRLRDQNMSNYFRQELIPKEMYLKSKYPRMENRLKTTWYKGANKF